MTYDTMRASLGREPVIVVELDLDYCANTYGTAPCTAAVGVTGPAKCYNTRRTCQDSPNYVKTTKTYRFSNMPLPVGAIQAIPSVLNYQSAPTVIDPAKSLGARASVTVTFQDGPLADNGIDQYLSERSYDSFATGTFWGKLIRRNTYYNGRIMRVRVGYLTDPIDWANFQTYTYVIDVIEGPDSSGRIRVTGKDLLKLADDERAQAPGVNSGKLVAAITSGSATTTVAITTADIDAEYGTSGTVRIDNECMTFTRVTGSYVLTFVTRGTNGTTADAHDADASVQETIVYTAQLPHDIAYDLLTTYARVPTAYINKAAWDVEANTWLTACKLSAVISKPVGVNDLLTELTQQALFYIWWDERTQLIQLRAIRPARETEIVDANDDDTAISGSLSTTEDPTKRISQVWVFYALASPTVDESKEQNYHQLAIQADLAAEGVNEYGDQRITKVLSRWFPDDGSAVNANLLGNRLVYRYRNAPRMLSMRVDAKDVAWTGDTVRVTSKVVQDDTGAPLPTTFQVMSVTETIPGTQFQLDMQDTFFNGRYAFITENSEPVYGLASDTDKGLYGFTSPGILSPVTDPVFADGGSAYKII